MKKLLALTILAATCTYALAASAFWTGRQEQVTTVTYQVAWRCEYNYLGRTFWRVFQGSCPSSVDVY